MSLVVAGALVIAVVDGGIPSGVPNLEVVESVANPSPIDHGQKIVDAIIAEIPAGTDYRILYASAFEGEADQDGAIVMDWSIMTHAMVKFRDAGATHVCTSFTGEDVETAQVVADFAKKLGLTIVASMGNDERQTPRLGTLDGVVGVIADEYSFPIDPDSMFGKAIDYRTSGVLPSGSRGSSFAAARVCVRLAIEAQAAGPRL